MPKFRLLAVLGFTVLALTACDRPKTIAPAAVATNGARTAATASQGELPASPDVSSVHWLGKKRIAADTNAAGVMAIWNLPESGMLGEQTLDKLALAPWRLLKVDAATNGAPISLLRPLLDDLVAEESLLTIYHPTNHAPAWSIAVKLPADRARLWQTNIAVVLASLTGDSFTVAGDGLAYQSSNRVFRLSRTNEWTVLSSSSRDSKPGIKNLEFDVRSVPPATTNWLTLSLNLAAIDRTFGFGWQLSTNWPRCRMAFAGVNQRVQTRGTLVFPKPLNLAFEPWRIPTNLIHDPLIGFTAVRGVKPLLASSAALWSEPLLGSSPDQLFAWTLAGINLMSYFAAPLHEPEKPLSFITRHLLADGNAWLGTNGMGYFSAVEDGKNGVTWIGVPFMAPFISTAREPSVLFAGFFPPPRTTNRMPRELLIQIEAKPRLVYYDWELTGARAESFIDVGQLARTAFLRPQVPATNSMAWVVALSSRLGNCTTSIEANEHGGLDLLRSSDVGLSAIELHLLVDWLASPAFPHGIHSTVAELPPKHRQRLLESRGALPRSAHP